MDPTLLGTLISAAVSILSVLIYHRTIAPPAAPGAPTAPPMQAPALPAPAAPASGDPFAGLPGLPGHPVLNVIFPWLTQALAPHPAAAVAAAAGEPAAIALLAHAVKQSPTAKAQMQALLG